MQLYRLTNHMAMKNNIPEHPPDNPASICASELCKERSYKYQITAVLHCIVKKIVKKLRTN